MDLVTFQQELGKQIGALKSVLPASVTPEKFARIAFTAISANSRLLDGNRQVLFAELVKCASDGLLPDGREAAIVPFKGTGKYMPMVAGICKRARNSGAIKGIDAQVVYSNDVYESWIDENGSHFKHVKARKERGEVVLTYAYAKGSDGEFYHEEILEEDMLKIKATSKANDTPWNGPFADEMRRKSAIRRLMKYRVPSSADVDDLIRRDDEMHELTTSVSAAKTEEEIKQSVETAKVEYRAKIDARADLIDSIKDQIESLILEAKSIPDKVGFIEKNFGILGVGELRKLDDKRLAEIAEKVKVAVPFKAVAEQPKREPTAQEKTIAKMRETIKE